MSLRDSTYLQPAYLVTALRQILAIEFFVNYSNAVCGKSIAINTTLMQALSFFETFFSKTGS